MTLAPDKMGAIIQALEYIHEHPKEWDQKQWRAWVYPDQNETRPSAPIGFVESGSCGTVACLAGRISIQQPEFELTPSTNHPGFYDGSLVRYKNETQHISYAVTDFLVDGSDDCEEDENALHTLFQGANNENELWYLASRLTEEDLTPPPGVSIGAGRETYEKPVEDDDYEF